MDLDAPNGSHSPRKSTSESERSREPLGVRVDVNTPSLCLENDLPGRSNEVMVFPQPSSNALPRSRRAGKNLVEMALDRDLTEPWGLDALQAGLSSSPKLWHALFVRQSTSNG